MKFQAILEIEVDGDKTFKTVMDLMKFMSKQKKRKMELELKPGKHDIVVLAKNSDATAFAVITVE